MELNLSEDLGPLDTLLKKGYFTDLTVSFGFNAPKDFRVHKAIVVAYSGYFRKLLTGSGNFTESVESHVKLPDENSKIFERFVAFVYGTWLTDNDINSSVKLYELADYLDAPELKKATMAYIMETIEVLRYKRYRLSEATSKRSFESTQGLIAFRSSEALGMVAGEYAIAGSHRKDEMKTHWHSMLRNRAVIQTDEPGSEPEEEAKPAAHAVEDKSIAQDQPALPYQPTNPTNITPYFDGSTLFLSSSSYFSSDDDSDSEGDGSWKQEGDQEMANIINLMTNTVRSLFKLYQKRDAELFYNLIKAVTDRTDKAIKSFDEWQFIIKAKDVSTLPADNSDLSMFVIGALSRILSGSMKKGIKSWE